MSLSFPEIDAANVAFEALFETYKQIYPVESYYHKSEGYMQWNTDGELIDVTAQNMSNLLGKIKQESYKYRCLTCKKVFSCEAAWKEHGSYTQLNSNKNCKCDVFKNGKYAYTVNYVNPIKQNRHFKG